MFNKDMIDWISSKL